MKSGVINCGNGKAKQCCAAQTIQVVVEYGAECACVCVQCADVSTCDGAIVRVWKCFCVCALSRQQRHDNDN